ncbi:TcpQ domain-containing protein [Pseudomonas sp. Pseusp122]|uniref:PFGI-1 class ICE element type IV pilus protein PilL2 n=1 Tax=unclassified Pseudomonas TaxID=196821 RepID=UPI0039A5DC95
MIRQLTTLSIFSLIAGCTLQGAGTATPVLDNSRNPAILAPDLYSTDGKPDDGANVRYGRYTLVNTAPEVEQRDLMSQIIDVNIPSNMHPQVQDAMQYVVDRSGYTLCPANTDHVSILYTRPLPAAQYKLGPMSLRNTLQVLAGPAWLVKVDEVSRNVCFSLRSGYEAPRLPAMNVALGTPSVAPGQSIALAPGSANGAVAIPATPTAPIITSVPVTAVNTVPSTPVDPAKEGPHLPPINTNPKPAADLGIPTPFTSGSTGTAALKSTTVAPNPVAAAAAVPAAATAIPATPAHPPAQVITTNVVTAPVKPNVMSWTVNVSDINMRHTLKRWATKAGYTFDEREHWVSPVDIPITASATFNGDFIEAAQGLVGTTELSDTPLQPCFYENNVIRVVNYNVTCDAASAR